jgi:hypothetical protein
MPQPQQSNHLTVDSVLAALLSPEKCSLSTDLQLCVKTNFLLACAGGSLSSSSTKAIAHFESKHCALDLPSNTIASADAPAGEIQKN